MLSCVIFQFLYYWTRKALWPKLTIAYLQARNAWAQYGLAIVGFVTGAAAPMPSSYKGRWVFGPNDEVKNVFYNGALQHSVQQLYMSTSISCVLVSKVQMCCVLLILIPCSQVYLGHIIAGTLPPPPLLLPPVTFPRHATHGIPATQANRSSSAQIPKPSHSKVGLDALSEGNNTSGGPDEDALKQRLVEVTPGSREAEDLMESLTERVKKLQPKNKTTASLLGIFAKALWKDRQGMFLQCNLQGHM